jgi:hypothetical protein
MPEGKSCRRQQMEIIMSKLIRLALVALVLTGASEAMARNSHDPFWTDMSKPYGGYDPNSQEGARAYLDYQAEH